MTFRHVATAGVALYAGLFLVQLIAPALYVTGYGVPADTGGLFMTRRSAPFYLGLAVLLWFVRSEPPSRLRGLIATSQAILLSAFAATGLHDYLQGLPDARIFVGIAVELSLAAAFWVTRAKP